MGVSVFVHRRAAGRSLGRAGGDALPTRTDTAPEHPKTLTALSASAGTLPSVCGSFPRPPQDADLRPQHPLWVSARSGCACRPQGERVAASSFRPTPAPPLHGAVQHGGPWDCGARLSACPGEGALERAGLPVPSLWPPGRPLPRGDLGSGVPTGPGSCSQARVPITAIGGESHGWLVAYLAAGAHDVQGSRRRASAAH